MFFRVTLMAYGYTFIAKGTMPAYVSYLEHEAAVYTRLRPLQGICVPVFLGAIDLRLMDRVYCYDIGVRVVHLTFLSWAGECVELITTTCDMDKLNHLKEEALGTVKKLY